jgi:TolC family type I secretion outer membrane protein
LEDDDLYKSGKQLEAEMIAEKSAKHKTAEKKPLNETEVSPEVAKAKASKVADLAWVSIRNQKINASKPLTLAELIDIGLRNNPATRQAWENTLVARAQEKQAASKLYPQLSLSQKITREKQVSSLGINSIDDLHYGPSIKLTYLLLDFGGRSASIEETVQGILAADSQYNQAIQDLLLDVESSYYGLYSAQSGLEAAEDDVKNALADFDAAQNRFDAGLVTKLDVLQAKSNYDDALYSLENAKGQVKSAEANLAQAIGIAADTKFEIAIPTKPIPTNIDEGDASRLIEEAIEKRPDIAALRADLKAKQAAIKAATSDLLPALNLGGTAGKAAYKYYEGADKTESDREYSAYLSVDWNIFDGFYNLNKRRQAKTEADIALEKLVQAEINLSADVWTRYYDFNTAVRKLAYSETYFDSTRTSYELALESYNAGLKDILDLLSAQSKLSQARSRLIQSKQDVFVALAQLAHATGSLDKDKEKKVQDSQLK